MARVKNGEKKVQVEGMDASGHPVSHVFQLSEEHIKDHKYSGTLADCVKMGKAFAHEVVYNLTHRMRDLRQMGGTKLFKVDKWPPNLDTRARQCASWLCENSLLFNNQLPAPATLAELTTDAGEEVQQRYWADRVACIRRYSSPSAATLGCLALPFLFPKLSDFTTAADLMSHLRSLDTRYRVALRPDFVARNQPPIPVSFFEWCSPSLLTPSVVPATAVDVLDAEEVGHASCFRGRWGGGGGGDGGSGGGG
ncbi:unnamed protein product [Closterium sp. NIES-54]